jgi:hypothetical protein
MVFHPPQKIVHPPLIHIEDKQIEYVDEFNFLGIIIDKNLSWKSHVNYISQKLTKICAIVNKLKHFLPKSTLLTIYNSLFQPHLNYGVLLWGSNSGHLFKLQKKVMRIITLSSYNAHTEPIFKQLNILKLKDICTLHELKFCYKLENKMLPSYFNSGIFTKNSQDHSYLTRNSNNFQIPIHRHSFVKKSIRYRIPHTFNDSPNLISEKIYTHTFQSFTRYAKNYFLNSYNLICSINNCYICGN